MSSVYYLAKLNNEKIVDAASSLTSIIYDKCYYSPKSEKERKFMEGIIIYHLYKINSSFMPIKSSTMRKHLKDIENEITELLPDCDVFSVVYEPFKNLIEKWAYH